VGRLARGGQILIRNQVSQAEGRNLVSSLKPMSRKKYVIVGDGAAGNTAARYLRLNDPQGLIEIISDDPNPAYFRAALTNYLIGELRDEQVWATPSSFYNDFNIKRQLARVTALDAANARLRLSNGRTEAYDRLLIATGARPNVLEVEGANLPGVMTLRTLQDIRQVLDWLEAQGDHRAVIVGGGPLAMEWAQGLRQHGAQVTIVIRDQGLMQRELDATASDLVAARLRSGGIELLFEEEVSAIFPDKEGRAAEVQLKSGGTLPCNLVGLAIGVRPNSEFLAKTAIERTPDGAVRVDARQRTSVENVFAAGDVAQVNGIGLQLWEPSRLQGRAAAHNMTNGAAVSTDLSDYYFATRLYDLDFALVSRPVADPDSELIDFPKGTGRISYRKLRLKNGKLISALLLGERKEKIRARGRLYQRLIAEGVEIISIRDKLLDAEFDLGGWLNARRRFGKISTDTHTLLISASELKRAQVVPESAPAPILVSDPELTPLEIKAIVSVGLSASQLKLGPTTEAAQPASAFLESGTRRWELQRGVALIGRAPDALVSLDDPRVSHAHAQISPQGNAFYLRDLGSRNGTWVNERQVSVPVSLKDGDRIQIGSTSLIFHWPNASTSIAEAGPEAARGGERPAELIGRSGAALGLEFELIDPPVTVGRDPASDVCLNEQTLSRWHAWLTQEADVWYVTDTGSRNGTFVNGKQLAPNERAPLTDGDEVAFGAVKTLYRRQGEER
jgi:nitrite reductase (NADH) large subunit